jgi:hypothetical protein
MRRVNCPAYVMQDSSYYNSVISTDKTEILSSDGERPVRRKVEIKDKIVKQKNNFQ